MSYNAETGEYEGKIFEMSSLIPYDANTMPASIMNTSDSILLLTENATSQGDRKIYRIPKSSPSTYVALASDQDAFLNAATSITRDFVVEPTGSVIFSRSIAAEKINAANVRVVKGGANAWVNPAAITGTCFPAIPTYINGVELMSPFSSGVDGKILMSHTGATAATNRLLAVQRTGLTSALGTDCAGVTTGGLSTVVHANATGLAGPVSFNAAGANPVAMVYVRTPAPATTAGKLIVAYSTPINSLFDNTISFNTGIVIWDVNEASDTAVTFVNPIIVYRDPQVVWAPSALAYDASTSSLYVSVGGSPGAINQTTANNPYNVEKFTIDLTGATPLQRVTVNNKSYFLGNSATKCISALAIE
jgi:hypothetical protein